MHTEQQNVYVYTFRKEEQPTFIEEREKESRQ
jgi:hypothetical protein